jgi:hypothetical protein
MSKEEKSKTTEFMKHAGAAAEIAGSVIADAASSSLKGLKAAITWENFGFTVGQVAMVDATRKVKDTVADRVSQAFEKKQEPEPDYNRRQRGHHRYGR